MNAPQALYLYSTDNSTVLTADVSTYVQAFNASAWAYNDIKPGMIDSVEVRCACVCSMHKGITLTATDGWPQSYFMLQDLDAPAAALQSFVSHDHQSTFVLVTFTAQIASKLGRTSTPSLTTHACRLITLRVGCISCELCCLSAGTS